MAVVTGAGSGIGRATARRLAAEGGVIHPEADAGGCLWGRKACHLCTSGVTPDAYHYLSECPHPALEELRLQSFTTAVLLLRLWKRGQAGQDAAGEEVARAVDEAAAALREAEQHRHTLPGQMLVYLASLEAPAALGDQGATASAAGLPLGWVPLLEMPVGAGRRRQQQTVAARVFAAFAPLTLHVAALRNGKGAVAAAAEAQRLETRAADAAGGEPAAVPVGDPPVGADLADEGAVLLVAL